jgi:glycosyltransferase involved in cell wall biosynthesis
MKSLCLITTGLSIGGAETMLFKLLQHIDRSSFEVSVISLTTEGEFGQRIEALGIPVYTLGMKPSAPSLFKFLQLVRYLRALKPDIVHTWMYHADLMGGLAAQLAGIRVIVWGLRNCNLSPERTKRSTILVMKICAKFSAWLPLSIVSCSERAASVHVDAGYCPDKMVVIPNGFDLSRFAPDAQARTMLRYELDVKPDVLLVGLIARDDPQKNHAGFIDAAARVARELPDVHFVLAGTDIDTSNLFLTQIIAESGLGERFHLLGRRDDIPHLMAALDVLASSSWGEAFPNVLGEAMACGVPCVVTDAGDSAEIVGDTGRVVATGDMAGLARQIVELLSQRDLRVALGYCARNRVRNLYEISDVARRYEFFYNELHRGKKNIHEL